MKKSNQKTVGIVGGMGPGATALLFQKLIDYTDAKSDSEHIHIVIDNNTTIPDRTSAILAGDHTPAVCICESGKKLEKFGADLILLPCNTSHYYYAYIQEQLNIPVINMITETAKECVNYGYTKVGVLATTGTCKTETYDKELEKFGVSVIYPDGEGQEKVMEIIYDQVKAGNAIDVTIVEKHLKEMTLRGAQAFVLGCTELPIAFGKGDYGYHFIDSLDVLARRAVEMAGYPLKSRKLQ